MLILVALASSASSAHAKKLFANIVWSPSPFDFGQVVPPATAKQTFTLFNVGERSSGRIAVTLSGSPAFAISKDRCTDKALRPNKSCEVIVEYEPSTTNADAGTLTATAKKASTFENVYGNGTADLTLSPGAFLETVNGTNFYDASGAFVSGFPEIFTVSNRGTGISEVLTTTAGGGQTRSLRFPRNLADSINLRPATIALSRSLSHFPMGAQVEPTTMQCSR